MATEQTKHAIITGDIGTVAYNDFSYIRLNQVCLVERVFWEACSVNDSAAVLLQLYALFDLLSN
jgi:hypothetical protein